jgi:uroporphyrinogen III methyltransferase/synthase
MGMSALRDITQGLLAAGMDGDTPAAVLEQGTTPSQRRVVATLGTLEAEAAQAGIGTPAIIVVGAVAALAEELCWYERLPLFGKRYVLTRPSERMEPLAQKLRARGAQVLEAPAIRLRPVEMDDEIRQAMKKFGEGAWDCLVFTSPAGVRVFFDLLFAQGLDSRNLSGCRISVIGSGTGEALRKFGLLADLMPEKYDGVSLGTLLGEELRDGSRVLIPRSAIGNPKLITSMEQRCRALGKQFFIQDLPIYETEAAEPAPAVQNALREGSIDGIFFTSASTVRGFLQLYPDLDVTKLRALCMGEMTAEAAQKAGMQAFTAKNATVNGLVELADDIKRREFG